MLAICVSDPQKDAAAMTYPEDRAHADFIHYARLISESGEPYAAQVLCMHMKGAETELIVPGEATRYAREMGRLIAERGLKQRTRAHIETMARASHG